MACCRNLILIVRNEEKKKKLTIALLIAECFQNLV